MDQLILIVLILALLSIVWIIHLFLKKAEAREIKFLQIELKKQRQEFFLPNRFQAYQQAILFLERIHPNNLVLRLNKPGIAARVLQTEMLKNIREEYDQNIAHQLFLSATAWGMIKKSREDVVRIINLAGDQMSETSTSLEFSVKIFEMLSQLETLTVEVSIDFVKGEFQDNL
ncbi:MAG: hypothetical protein FJY17_08255 [Bacteroidetes bacterium]|nr:hypothetical protein [Bacteroidota bacterium]